MTSKPPYLHTFQSSRAPDLHELQTYSSFRPTRASDLHELQTYTLSRSPDHYASSTHTTSTSIIKREGKRSRGMGMTGRR